MFKQEALRLPPPAKCRQHKGIHSSRSSGHFGNYRSCCGYDNADTDK